MYAKNYMDIEIILRSARQEPYGHWDYFKKCMPRIGNIRVWLICSILEMQRHFILQAYTCKCALKWIGDINDICSKSRSIYHEIALLGQPGYWKILHKQGIAKWNSCGKGIFWNMAHLPDLLEEWETWSIWKGAVYVLWRYPSTSIKLVGRKWTWGIWKEFCKSDRKNNIIFRTGWKNGDIGHIKRILQVWQEKQFHLPDLLGRKWTWRIWKNLYV